MLAQIGLDPQEALVCTMVLVAVTDGGITDREAKLTAIRDRLVTGMQGVNRHAIAP